MRPHRRNILKFEKKNQVYKSLKRNLPGKPDFMAKCFICPRHNSTQTKIWTKLYCYNSAVHKITLYAHRLKTESLSED